jgi:hypothetical protein
MLKPMFSDGDEQHPLLSEEDLRDACLHAVATIVVGFALEGEFKCCYLTDDGYKWPTSVSRTWLEYPKDWTDEEALSNVATIYEAGSLSGRQAAWTRATPHQRRRRPRPYGRFPRRPLNWELVEAVAVAQLIMNNYEGDGCYGAEGTNPHWSLSFPWMKDLPKLNENSNANRLIKNLLAARFKRPAP